MSSRVLRNSLVSNPCAPIRMKNEFASVIFVRAEHRFRASSASARTEKARVSQESGFQTGNQYGSEAVLKGEAS